MAITKQLKISGVGIVLLGRVISGTVKKGDSISIIGSKVYNNIPTTVKSLEIFSQHVNEVSCGYFIAIHVMNVAVSQITRGALIGHTFYNPPQLCRYFTASILLIDKQIKLTKKSCFQIILQTKHITCKIEDIINKKSAITGKTIEDISNIKYKEIATIFLKLQHLIAVDINSIKLIKFVFRISTEICGVGKILETFTL